MLNFKDFAAVVVDDVAVSVVIVNVTVDVVTTDNGFVVAVVVITIFAV